MLKAGSPRLTFARSCGLTGGALLLYAVLLPPVYRMVGGAAAAGGVVVVVAASTLLGSCWGIAVALLLVPIHAAVFAWMGEPGILPHAVAGVLTAGVGGVVGRLRELGLMLRQSHGDLERALAEARLAQQHLAEREAQLAQAQVMAHLGYWDYDLNTSAMTWSAELCHILGEDPATTQPSVEGWWKHVHPEDRQLLRRALDRAKADGSPEEEEFRVFRTDGRLRWMYGRTQAIPGANDGRMLVGTLQDITEQRELQAKLTASERLATVGTLAAGVAHEINNPLAYVVNNVEFLREGLERHGAALPPEVMADLTAAAGEALHGADRVRRIVRDLKVFARTDQHSGPVEVERVLDLALNMAAAEIRFRAHVVKQYGAVPPVRGDASRLGQVFLNLIVNAAQAIPPGDPERNEIRLTTRLEEDQVVVSVRDTGTGMTPEVRRRVFEPFFTTKPIGAGMGLGLSTSLGIVRSMGGDITVESEPERGSEFTVNLLPAASEVEQADEGAQGPMDGDA